MERRGWRAVEGSAQPAFFIEQQKPCPPVFLAKAFSMSRRPKRRASLQEILASCSETLFPAEMGAAEVRLDSRGADGDTPLHVMLWRDDTYSALELIRAGADVNAVGDMSETPLHVAISRQNLKVIEALLEAGANTSLVSEFGDTPLGKAEAVGGDVRRLLRGR